MNRNTGRKGDAGRMFPQQRLPLVDEMAITRYPVQQYAKMKPICASTQLGCRDDPHLLVILNSAVSLEMVH